MSEQIIQTLGFDASAAITTINELNRSLATLDSQLSGVAKAAQTFNKSKLSQSLKTIAGSGATQSLKGAAGAAGRLGEQLAVVGGKGGQAIQNLDKQSKSLTLSWKTLSRIILAQTVVRAFNAITGAIRNSITETRELQKRISEIQTIAGGKLGDNLEIGAGLQATAETFGFDILDVAEAKYQELSNQVDGSTDSLLFQNAAAKLARATNSSLADATNLLSSTLNAFGKDASSAESAAGLLFTTIEQGRIRANELANSLGRVAPLANALGVDFNELGAGLARVTQGGTRADAAITQLLGIMNKLQAPTPALVEAFEALGVATAEQGIAQSGGFLPFLIRLKEEAGDVSELTGFFKNIRAIQGVLALVGTDLNKTGNVFEAFQQTVAESTAGLNKAFTVAENNDAVEYEKLIQKLNGTFRELATATIPLINDALGFFLKTIEEIRANPAMVSGFFNVVGAGLGIMGVQAVLAAGGLTAVATAAFAAIIPILPLIIAFGVLTAAAVGLAVVMRQNEVAGFNVLVEKTRKLIKGLKEDIKASTDALDAQSASFKVAAKEAAEFGQKFLDLRKEAQESVRTLNDSFVDSATSALNSLLKSRQQISKAIQKTLDDADGAAVKSASKIADIQGKKDDFLLKRRLNNLNDIQKAFKLFEASQDQVFKARTKIEGQDTDLADFDSAAKILETRLSLAQQGLSAAKASGDAGAIFKAEQQVVTALNDQVNLEIRRNTLIQERRKLAEAALAADKAQTQQLKTLVGQFSKELSILNKSGGLLNDAQLASQEQKVAKLQEQLNNFALTSDQVSLTDFLGLQNLAGQFTQDLTTARGAVAQGGAGLVKEAKSFFSELNALVPDDLFNLSVDLNLTTGEGGDRLASLTEATAAAAKEIDTLTGAQKLYTNSQLAVVAAQKQIDEIFKNTTGPKAFRDELQRNLDFLKNHANASIEDVKKVQAFLTQTKDRFSGRFIDLGGPDVGDAQAIDALGIAFKTLAVNKESAAKIETTTEGDRNRLVALQEFLELEQAVVNKQSALITVIGEVDAATGQVTAETARTLAQVNLVEGAWGGVGKVLDEIIAKKAQANAAAALAAAPGGGPGAMFGGSRGMLFRAAGGFARGTDTIPAMLSPGEFVVNASSSRRFASQLQAINSGVNPIFRQEGGPVVNNTVNVGDINVNGTANPDDTARRVVSQLRREFRRGTASRF